MRDYLENYARVTITRTDLTRKNSVHRPSEFVEGDNGKKWPLYSIRKCSDFVKKDDGEIFPLISESGLYGNFSEAMRRIVKFGIMPEMKRLSSEEERIIISALEIKAAA